MIDRDNSDKTGYIWLVLAAILIMSFGVGWRITSTAAGAVSVSSKFPAPATFDSLGRYLRPMPATAGRTGTEPADFFSTTEYFAPRGRSGSDDGAPSTASRPGTRPRWVVSAILLTELRKLAVLNDSVVVLGSLLPGGARVIAIESDHVVLQESSGARRVISMNR